MKDVNNPYHVLFILLYLLKTPSTLSWRVFWWNAKILSEYQVIKKIKKKIILVVRINIFLSYKVSAIMPKLNSRIRLFLITFSRTNQGI